MRLKTEFTLEDFKEMEQMEREYYSEEFIAPAEEAMRWYEAHPFSVKAVEAEGRIAGFMNLFPVIVSIAEKILSGEFNDSQLKAEHIESPESAKCPLNLFLSCIVVRAEYRHTGMVRFLMNEYMKEIERWDIPVGQIVMETVTSDGARFARRLGMKPVIRKEETVVWRTDFACMKAIIRADI